MHSFRLSLFPRSLLSIAAVSAALIANPAGAQDDATTLETVVVSATRTPQPIDLTGASISIITGTDLATQQIVDVNDALGETPGTVITRNGGIGQTSTDSIRGAETGQTLLLIDGVRIEDPSATDGGAVLQDLLVNNIDRIEVLRGPQSTLYGSDAIGGVVNIITRRGGESPLAFTGTAEGGSFDTEHVNLAVNGTFDDIEYGAAANGFITNAVSAADARNGNSEPDGYKNVGLAGNARWIVNDMMSIDLRGYYTRSRDSFDGFPPPNFTFQDDPEFGDDALLAAYGGINLSLLDGTFTNRFALLLLQSDRRTYGVFAPNPPYSFSPAENFSGKGGTTRFEYQGIFEVDKATELTFGAESQLTTLATESIFDITPGIEHGKSFIYGIYGQAQTTLFDELTLTGGVRYDHDEEFGSRTSVKLNAAWRLFDWGTVLRGNYGDGFKAPSLYEQFSDYSNPVTALAPETAKGWEVGADQEFLDGRMRASLTYFDRRTHNLIEFFDCFGMVSAACTARAAEGGYYYNIGHTAGSGIEAELAAHLLDTLSLTANYTNLTAKDLISALPLPREPHVEANGVLTWTPTGGTSLGGSVSYVGPRFDDAFASVPLADHLLFNVFGSYKLTAQYQLFARIENLLDKHYEPVAGYGSPGRAVYGGVRVTL